MIIQSRPNGFHLTDSPPWETYGSKNALAASIYDTAARIDFWMTDTSADLILYYGTRRTLAGQNPEIHFSTTDPAVIADLIAGKPVDASAWTYNVAQHWGDPRISDGRSYIETVGTVEIRLDPVHDSTGQIYNDSVRDCGCGAMPGAFLPTCDTASGLPAGECYKDLPETYTLHFNSGAFADYKTGRGLIGNDAIETNPNQFPGVLPPGMARSRQHTHAATTTDLAGCGEWLPRFQQPIVMRKAGVGRDTTYVSDPIPLRPCQDIIFKFAPLKDGNTIASLSFGQTSTAKVGFQVGWTGHGGRPILGCQWSRDYWQDNPSEYVTAFNAHEFPFFHGLMTVTPGGTYTPETILSCPDEDPNDIGYAYSSNCRGLKCPPSEFLLRLTAPSSGSGQSQFYGDYYIPFASDWRQPGTRSRPCTRWDGFRESVTGPYLEHVVSSDNSVSIQVNFGGAPGSSVSVARRDGCPCGMMGPFMNVTGQIPTGTFNTNAYRLPKAVGHPDSDVQPWPLSACVEFCSGTEQTIDFGDVRAQLTTSFGSASVTLFGAKIIIPAVT